MKNLTCWIGLLVAFSAQARSQTAKSSYNTTVQAESGIFHYNKLAFPFSPKAGFSVSRKVWQNKLSIGAGYSRWISSWYQEAEQDGDYTQFTGQLFAREDYRFFDLYGKYAVERSHNVLYANVGLSYARGKDWHITRVVAVPGYHDIIISTGITPARYLGGIAMVGYNHLLFKRRIHIGLAATLRYYSAEFQQYEANLNIGYNFNLF